MGKQKGALQLQGSHGEFTFARTKDGFIWREKSKLDKEQFMKSEAFAAQRDNCTEFTASAKAAKLLRQSFRDLVVYAKDRKFITRLITLMMAITKAAPAVERGKRRPEIGPLEQLEGFEFNADARLDSVLNAASDVTFDRATGKAKFAVPSFLAMQMLSRPDAATHYRLLCGAAEVDFAGNVQISGKAETALLPITAQPTAAVSLNVQLTADSTLPVFVAAGIRFSEVVNGFEYPVKTGDSNALSLALVDTI